MQPARSPSCLCAASIAVAALATGDVGAVSSTRLVLANAASYCQTALPVFDGNIRKRPLSVQNEGRSNAFVTCSFTAQATELDYVLFYASNTGDAATSLSCTGVTGYSSDDNEYVTRTITVPTSGQAFMTWTGADFAGSPDTIPGDGLFSVSCNLPPGVGIDDSAVSFSEDVGS